MANLFLRFPNERICECGHTVEEHEFASSLADHRYCKAWRCKCDNYTKLPRPAVTWNDLYDALKRAGFQLTAELIESWQDEWATGDENEPLS